MSGGGKGGSQTQTTEVKIPKWLEGAARDNIAKANEIAKIGYVPYYGPDVAAFSPMQEAAFANTGAAANAFGMAGGGTGMPEPQTFAGGMRGYSSAPLYEESLAALAANRPGQYDAINNMFIDPLTGGAMNGGGAGPGQPAPPQFPHLGAAFLDAMQNGTSVMDFIQNYNGGYVRSDDSQSNPRPAPGTGNLMGGYTGFGDMINGGGPGASGSTFQGGGMLSNVANAVASPAERSGGGGQGGK